MLRRKVDAPPERGGCKEIAAICGFSVRKLQMLAAQGKIPSAARLAGGVWSFDIAEVRAWIKQAEDENENRPRRPWLLV